jgi:Zn-dependent protease
MLLSQMSGSFFASIFVMALFVSFINLVLMIFNLIPIPPLDGSKILYTFLPAEWKMKFYNLERYGFIIILVLLMFGFIDLIFYPILYIFRFLVGF